jgi:hypothetical protein
MAGREAGHVRVSTADVKNALTHSLPGAITHVGSWPTQVIASNQLCP